MLHNEIYITKHAEINNWKFDALQHIISAGTDIC